MIRGQSVRMLDRQGPPPGLVPSALVLGNWQLANHYELGAQPPGLVLSALVPGNWQLANHHELGAEASAPVVARRWHRGQTGLQ